MAPFYINGSTGISGVDGSAGTPALQGSDTNTGIAFGSDVILGSTGGTERFRCDSSGRLLVGTSSSRSGWFNSSSWGNPTLQVEGTSVFNSGISVTNNSNDDNGSQIFLGKSRATSVGGVTVVSSGDNLGRISFQGADGSELVAAATIECNVDGTSGANDMPGRLVFSTTADGASSPTERMRIKETGHSKFSNTGSYRFINTGNHEFLNSLNTIGLEVYNTNASLTSQVLQVSADRNTTNGTYKLIQASRIGTADVFWVLDSGNVQNVNNSYTGTSDIKLKENIVDANSQWEDIKSLQVRKFNFKEETGNSTHTQIGLIAQEVEQVSPGLVSGISDRDDEGNDLGTVTKSVNYSVLYMKAVKALQEAMERIEQLETEMAEVKAQLS